MDSDRDTPAQGGPDELVFRATDGVEARPRDGLPPFAGTLRFGILGCGKVANDFALALRGCRGAVLEAVASREADRAAAFAVLHRSRSAYGSYQALVEDEAVDIVYVATVPEHHRAHALLALEANKHVLVEKPLAASAADARAIVRAARERARFCAEGIWTRYFPAVEWARRAVEAGEIGAIRHVRADFSFDLEADEGPRSEKWAVGAALNGGVYPVHAALAFLGTSIESVSAAGIPDPWGFEKDAEMAAHLRFAGRRTAIVTWSHLARSAEEVDIVGTEGTIRLHRPAHCPTTVSITQRGASRARTGERARQHTFPLPALAGGFHYPRSEGLLYEAEAVARCLAAGLLETPQAPLDASVRVLEVLEEATRRWRSSPGR